MVDETKKYERMLLDCSASVKNLAEAEKGARRKVEELAARDATITQLRDQREKVTTDSNKKSTKIEDLRGDSSKKFAKVDDLRSQRTGLRNRLGEQAALHQAAVEERYSELANMRELLNIGTEDITTLQAALIQICEERERLQLRYNELGLSLVTAQEELEKARTLAGANAVAAASMTRPDSAKTRARWAPQTAGGQYHLEASTRGSRDRGDDSEDRPQRSSSRRSRDRDDVSRDRSHRSAGSRRSRDRDDFSGPRSQG